MEPHGNAKAPDPAIELPALAKAPAAPKNRFAIDPAALVVWPSPLIEPEALPIGVLTDFALDEAGACAGSGTALPGDETGTDAPRFDFGVAGATVSAFVPGVDGGLLGTAAVGGDTGALAGVLAGVLAGALDAPCKNRPKGVVKKVGERYSGPSCTL